MEELARELARAARQLERDLKDLQSWATGSNESTRPADSTSRSLDRIERTLGSVHAQTSTLVRRVPGNLIELLTELQRLIKQITARHQAQIVSTQILPAAEEEGFVRIAIKVRVRGVLPSILKSVYDVETHDVHMFVDNLSIRNNAAASRSRQLAMLPMDADFDLIAYMPEES